MKKEDVVRKLTSRKLWMSVAGFVTMLLVALGETENTAKEIAALIMAGATVIGYVVGEGLADASPTTFSIEEYHGESLEKPEV
ncbi:MAG: hypothetical protein IJR00_08000 [Lachnospiraceae bacterium]|nr:hypothetical protein [Lachnospiraceae bacterium]